MDAVSLFDLALVGQLGVTGLLTGLIWLVQLEIYPAFGLIPRSVFCAFHRYHCQRISWLVVPWMMLEMVLALLCFFWDQGRFGWPPHLGGFALIVLLFSSTFLLQVPCHQRLAKGFDADVHRRLVVTNWVRTAAWSARLIGLVLLVGLSR